MMLPPSAASAPVRILTRVLLPAPLAPISAWISPARTLRSADRRATTGPKCLATPRASRSGCGSSAGVSLRMPAIKIKGVGARPTPYRYRGLAGTLAGDQVLLAVGGVGLHVIRDAVVRVQAGVVRRSQLAHAICCRVVPDLRGQVDDVVVGVRLGQ